MGLGDLIFQINHTINAGRSALLWLAFSIFPGASNQPRQELNQFFQNEILGIADLIAARRKGHISKNEYQTEMTKVGFSVRNSENAYLASQQGLSLGEIVTLYLFHGHDVNNKFGVTEEWLLKRLEESGINPLRKDELIEANRNKPTLQDVILFSDRDVFNPNVVQRLGLMQEIKPRYITEAKRRGLTEEEAEWFWAAHWRPPSINQAYEMFQRLFDHPDPQTRFTRVDLETFFDIAEIPPGMRKSLLGIAYRTITRVDVRRFDKLGIYGTGESRRRALIRAYREIGYSPEPNPNNQPSDAELMTEFTIRFNSEQERDLTRSQLVKFFKQGLFDDETDPAAFLIQELQDIGFPEENANIITISAQLERNEEEQKDQIELIEQLFLSGEISSVNMLRERLRAIRLTNAEVETQLRRMQTKKMKSVKRIALRDMQQAVLQDIATVDEYETLLQQQGFPERDVEIMIELIERQLPSGSDNETEGV